MNSARVLIVEDERITAFELRLGLAGMGYTVVGTVARGDEAVERAGELRPDIVLMDVNVEGPKNGLVAAEEITDRFRIPIVFLTAYANDEIIERALASRPLGYLIKPYDERELHTTLQVALARHRLESTASRIHQGTPGQSHAAGGPVTADAAQTAGEASVADPAIAQDLEHALANEQFELQFLPTVALVDGALSGVEALLRWRHPRQGIVRPAQFIGIAEASGSIDTIGRWVLKRACAEVARWSFEHGKPLCVAVNVSVQELRSERFARIVQDALQDAGLAPERLQLEFSERGLSQLDHAEASLRRLKDLGVRLCVDDFGTGSLSLSRLKRLPVEAVKIDRSLIERLPGAPVDLAIVESMLAASHALELRVTAEGVTNEAQLAMLRQLGCHDAQGFIFSAPLSAAELGALAHGRAPWAAAALWGKPTLAEEDEHRYQPPHFTLH